MPCPVRGRAILSMSVSMLMPVSFSNSPLPSVSRHRLTKTLRRLDVRRRHLDRATRPHFAEQLHSSGPRGPGARSWGTRVVSDHPVLSDQQHQERKTMRSTGFGRHRTPQGLYTNLQATFQHPTLHRPDPWFKHVFAALDGLDSQPIATQCNVQAPQAGGEAGPLEICTAHDVNLRHRVRPLLKVVHHRETLHLVLYQEDARLPAEWKTSPNTRALQPRAHQGKTPRRPSDPRRACEVGHQ